MNEEEIKKIARETFIENVMNNLNSAIIFKYIQELEQKNARLKDKINKAINFVDKYMDEWDFQDEVWKDMNDLLILLKEN